MQSKKLTLWLMIFYLIALTWIILFKLEFSLKNLPHLRNINLIPFGQSAIVNGRIDISEIIYNALAFIPYGLLIHILWEKRSLFIQILLMAGTSLLFEIIQYTFAIGASDITDMISNTFGGIAGLVFALVLSKAFRKKLDSMDQYCQPDWRHYFNRSDCHFIFSKYMIRLFL